MSYRRTGGSSPLNATSRNGIRIVTSRPSGVSFAVRASYVFVEFGYAVVKSIIELQGGIVRIAALPPPV